MEVEVGFGTARARARGLVWRIAVREDGPRSGGQGDPDERDRGRVLDAATAAYAIPGSIALAGAALAWLIGRSAISGAFGSIAHQRNWYRSSPVDLDAASG
jgi:hypothetical protein